MSKIDELLKLAMEKSGIPAYTSERLRRKGIAPYPKLATPEDLAARQAGIARNVRKEREFLESLTPAQRKDLAMPSVQRKTMAQCLEDNSDYLSRVDHRLEQEQHYEHTLEQNILHAEAWELQLFKAAVEGERMRRKMLRKQRANLEA
nr:MAG TPA: hypothetical protein [Caudoviricetes sp.]